MHNEVIVTADDCKGFRNWSELPESREAGWNAHGMGPMTIAMRTIGF